MPLAIQADDVRAAAGSIRPLARKTPVMTCAGFDAEAGARVFFKCENLQRGGAFKIRGAANLVLSLSSESLARGVVAYSSGNHAQATAIAAKYVGAEAASTSPAATVDVTGDYPTTTTFSAAGSEPGEEG